MKSPQDSSPVAEAPSVPGDEATGLPWLKTWPAVYLFVLASFVLWVVLLFVLSRLYA